MKTLKKIGKKFETLMCAASFAEAGEQDTAREMLREDQPVKKETCTRVQAATTLSTKAARG